MKSFSLPTRKQSSLLSPQSPKNQKPTFVDLRFLRAPGVGIEPTTNRLTGDRSTAELPRNFLSNGGPKETRTPYLLIANEALYQMSYGPRHISSFSNKDALLS